MQNDGTFEDIQLPCLSCGKSFTFSADEQRFFKEKQLVHQPKHCFDCRVLNRARRSGHPELTAEVNCAECGSVTRVPFQPKGYKPILCIACIQRNRLAAKV